MPHGHHAAQHEQGGGDEIRPSIANGGTLLNRQRTINFSTGLSAVEDQANRRINVTASGTTVKNWLLAQSGGQAVGAASTRYTMPAGALSQNASETTQQVPAPSAGTLKNFFIHTTTAQPADGSLVATLRVNGVDTTLVVTVAANAVAANYSDTTHSVVVAQGDLLSVKWVNSSASNSAGIGSISMEADTS